TASAQQHTGASAAEHTQRPADHPTGSYAVAAAIRTPPLGRLLVFFAILTLLALEATIDATARGTVVGASGPLARADGSGPILVVDRQGAHRGAIRRGCSPARSTRPR